MVNFRFHLISLVAVFLSLAIGVSLGSGFVGEAATGRLKEDIESVRKQNGIVRDENLELKARLEDAESFALAVRSWMIEGALQGENVVFVRFDHTDSALTDAAAGAVEEADGTIASTLTVTDKLALGSGEEVQELANIVGITSSDPAEVRIEMAGRLGLFMSQTGGQLEPSSDTGPASRLTSLAETLQEAGYLTVELNESQDIVPSNAMFLILGGGSGRPGFNAWRFAIEMSSGLVEEGAAVAVAERSSSGWNLVQRVREDDRISGSVVTVDHAETTTSQIALVLGLARAGQGITGHYGSDEGASAPLPEAFLD
ncbi:MAG: hypothetical protein GEU78_01520 [Actinobacteria bacterium]|nr:hypothetical protein [Actinomycetota bacterium]